MILPWPHCNFQLRGIEKVMEMNFFVQVKVKVTSKSYFIRFDTESYSKENKLSIQLARKDYVIIGFWSFYRKTNWII